MGGGMLPVVREVGDLVATRAVAPHRNGSVATA
jgi:hypothetical protein